MKIKILYPSKFCEIDYSMEQDAVTIEIYRPQASTSNGLPTKNQIETEDGNVVAYYR